MLEIARMRLANQQLTASRCTSVKELVGRMGTLQAQDYAMAKWAVGVRLPISTAAAVEAAINSGEIIRTHVLRPTWHFVAANDVRWLLELTAPHIKRGLKSRREELGLSESIFAQCRQMLEKALEGGRHLTREALTVEFERARIASDTSRAYHLLLEAELDGVICSGAMIAGKPTYALLAERCPMTPRLVKDEALARLAKTYFSSHGPATIQDFAWWSGLPAGETRQALEMVRPNLAAETVASQTYWFSEAEPFNEYDDDTTCLLPAYDEFIISYTDRGATLRDENFKRAVSSNGVFRPVVLVNGLAAGIWKRTLRKDKVTVEAQWFNPADKFATGLIAEAAARYSRFLGLRVEISGRD